MHLIMILMSLSLAWGISSLQFRQSEHSSWSKILGLFLFSPLLLLTTAIAIAVMGPREQIIFPGEDWFSYGLAIAFLVISGLWSLKLFLEGRGTLRKIRSYPTLPIPGHPSGSQRTMRVLETPLLYSAQVGFWEPELVVTQGLLKTLNPEHLSAVLAHEQAHYHYRDTFWFFGLGWLRRISGWLPQTEVLWQELIILRELRADRRARQHIDALLIAEALLQVVQTQPQVVQTQPILSDTFCTAFDQAATPTRLAQRIETLISTTEEAEETPIRSLFWLIIILLPFLAIPFHH